MLSGGRERDDCMLGKLRFVLHIFLFTKWEHNPHPRPSPRIINLCSMTGVLSGGGSDPAQECAGYKDRHARLRQARDDILGVSEDFQNFSVI